MPSPRARLPTVLMIALLAAQSGCASRALLNMQGSSTPHAVNWNRVGKVCALPFTALFDLATFPLQLPFWLMLLGGGLPLPTEPQAETHGVSPELHLKTCRLRTSCTASQHPRKRTP